MQIWRHFFSQIIVFSKEKIDSEAFFVVTDAYQVEGAK